MVKCEKCGSAMIRVAMYDPGGEIPLEIKQVDGELWTCQKCSKEKYG